MQSFPRPGPHLAGRHRPRERPFEEACRRSSRRDLLDPGADGHLDVLVRPRLAHADLRPGEAAVDRSSASSAARIAPTAYRTRDFTVPTGMPSVSAISVWLSDS